MGRGFLCSAECGILRSADCGLLRSAVVAWASVSLGSWLGRGTRFFADPDWGGIPVMGEFS